MEGMYEWRPTLSCVKKETAIREMDRSKMQLILKCTYYDRTQIGTRKLYKAAERVKGKTFTSKITTEIRFQGTT
jgi:hypothetical protein